MEIKIQSIHFEADQKLLDFIEKKVIKLDTYFDRPIHAEVYLKLDNGNTVVKDKVVEIKITIPGTTLFSKDHSKSFEESTISAVDHMRRQLKKHRDKIRSK
jgi:putative sigma-54 modulation protein